MVLTGSTLLSRQYIFMDIREHRGGIRNYRVGVRDNRLGIRDHHVGVFNHRVGVRNDRVGICDHHIGVECQFGLEGNCSVLEYSTEVMY